ncbi:Uncharacterized membrane protein [Pustulibacterium marinum]|uniref:Uncharacterized membrane protein n=1 Tax=Pustulibacterium marinum TaxID=1224947 RepID=A0A1I7II66_9FLAO|nr:hypothetical protein [Pustulibacterium marinum]SFU72615.1 Uncharacterized membrane protein [Pustulibacterium marinum]
MKPLFVLLIATLIAVTVYKLVNGTYNLPLAASIGMSIMLLFTAMGHFMFTKGMAMMIPDFIPYKAALVYVTAFIELCGAIALHISSFQKVTAWLLIFFFIMMLPANIYAALKHVDYQNATYTGNGLNYLWFRIPLQFVYIAWVYLSSITYH